VSYTPEQIRESILMEMRAASSPEEKLRAELLAEIQPAAFAWVQKAIAGQKTPQDVANALAGAVASLWGAAYYNIVGELGLNPADTLDEALADLCSYIRAYMESALESVEKKVERQN
jgi:hypothetical protein